MKQFFKMVFATWFGLVFFFGLIIVIILGIGAAADKPVEVKKNSLLHIKLSEEVIDRASSNPFENFNFGSMESEEKLGLNNILTSLKRAAKDEHIKGIFLDLSEIKAGMATLEEIRDGIQAFKDSSGKFVISYSEGYSQKAYYLATVADEVYMYPEGDLSFTGMSSQIMFMKGLFEKLEIEPQIIRHGKFKSAVEPLMLDSMSPANREQTMTYMGSLWNHMLDGVAAARGLSRDELNLIADSMYIREAKDAVDRKLIDGVLYTDELYAKLRGKLGIEEKDKINYMTLGKYAKVEDEDKGELRKEKIAVIYAQGDIESGQGDNETIGSDRIAGAIREAREDEKVKAIVLRVNSPGGSALASDVMWREVILAKKVKPVVVSMGDVAASGGYYISCAADKIFASENTITGSIGVFGVIPNFGTFMKNKLGITIDGVKTNANADMGLMKPLTTYQRNVIQHGVEKVYTTFITKVADGRGITTADVDSVGQGRVWSGIDAKERKLVDEFGGLNRAIEEAAILAKLDEYRLLELPKQKDPMEEILSEMMGEKEDEAVSRVLGTHAKYFEHLRAMTKWEGIQARMPYYLEVE